MALVIFVTTTQCAVYFTDVKPSQYYIYSVIRKVETLSLQKNWALSFQLDMVCHYIIMWLTCHHTLLIMSNHPLTMLALTAGSHRSFGSLPAHVAASSRARNGPTQYWRSLFFWSLRALLLSVILRLYRRRLGKPTSLNELALSRLNIKRGTCGSPFSWLFK